MNDTNLGVGQYQDSPEEKENIELRREISLIDEAFARRPALADCKTRYEKAMKACAAGSELERVKAELDGLLVAANKLSVICNALDTADKDNPFDPQEPMCEMCGQTMELHDGCDWSEVAGENICDLCAQQLVLRIRQAITTAMKGTK